ncbi:MAG: hypothetical protein J6B68_09405 [Lachnospiraceae bacterium]|nr:hypothetical protein [Lachnospiraceae bacterium]
MNWINMILSSAVIAAITSYIATQKSNQLKYITSERAKWRKEIKRIAGDLSECERYNKKAKRLLTDLKLRINSYGKKEEYPSDICLNFFEDEHIWKEISKIEAGADFILHRDRVLRYLELLLKFDWERSKRETKTEQKTIVLAMVFLAIIIVSVFVDYAIVKGNAISSNILEIIQEEGVLFSGQIVILLLFLLPFLGEYTGFSKKEKTYNKNALEFVCCMLGELIVIFGGLWYLIKCEQSIYLVFIYIETFLGMLFLAQEINGKRNYREYSNCVMQCFADEPLLIYSGKSTWKDMFCLLFIEPKFNDYGITYKRVYALEALSQNEASQIISKWWTLRKYNKLKKKNEELTEKEFLIQYPKACKIFVKRGVQMVTGFSLKKYEEMAIEISKEL